MPTSTLKRLEEAIEAKMVWCNLNGIPRVFYIAFNIQSATEAGDLLAKMDR